MTSTGTASVRDRLRPFLPRVTLQWLADHPTTTHREFEGSVVFVDISGFTKLSEKLAKRGKIGAEEMADAINGCFSELLRVAYEEDGSLLKFGGDALLLFFTGGSTQEHATRACRAAAAMRQRLREVGRLETKGGRVSLRMSVGVHTGTFHFFLVGDSHRELIVTGPATSEVVEMEGTAGAGEIVVSPSTAALLPASSVGLAKGPGWLLRSSPGGDRLGSISTLPDVEDELLRGSVPSAMREFLLFGSHEPEHRQVAIAFLHFDGTDRLIEEEGSAVFALELDRLVRDVQQAADAQGVCFLATDVDHDGGKIILTAGAPRSTGSDEERLLIAVRQIADVHRMIPVRIGVHRGHVFVGEIGPDFRRTFTVMGDAVNLSARVMGKAEPTQVLVTTDVLTSSRLSFESRALEPFMVKGKARPVHAHELGKATDLVATEARAVRFPLVGRATELAAIEAAIGSAREGRGQLIDVIGDAGMGKSRLVEETVQRAEGFSTWVMHCQLYAASTPYAPFRRPLREAVGIRETDSDEDALARLTDVVREQIPHLESSIPLLGTPLDIQIADNDETAALGERFRRERMEQATGELLAALLPRPAIVTIEDVHWMDEASAGLLRRLGANIGAGPWLVLVTRRASDGGFSTEELGDAISLRLGPLDPADAREALAAVSEDDPIAPRQLEGVTERAGGNPLFLVELFAALRQSGDLEGLPDTVEGLVTAQIDALRPRDRELLRYVSVLGDTFSEGLARIVLAYELQGVDRQMWRYLDAFLVRGDADTLRFRNAIVRDVAYEGLTFRRRRMLHGLVGETIERFAEDANDEAEILSLHFLRADEDERAWRYSRVAAERAAGIYANVEAAVFYQRALEAARGLPSVTDGDRLTTLEALGEVRERAGLFKEAIRAFADARRLCGDTTCRARLMLKQARMEDMTGRSSNGLRWLSRALHALEGAEGSDRTATAVRAQIRAWYGAIRLSQGRFRDAVRWCEQATEDAQASGDQDALAHALYILDWAHLELGHPELATHMDEVLQLYGELGDVWRQADAYNLLGTFAYWDGHWTEAATLYEKGRDRQLKAGDVVSAAIGTVNIAEILGDQGHLEDAEAMTREALRIFRTSSYRLGIAFTESLLGRIQSRDGRHDEARVNLDEALRKVREGGDQLEEVATLGRIAEDLSLQGKGAEAKEITAEALTRAEGIGGPAQHGPMLQRALGWSLLQTGDPAAAQRAFERSLELARARGSDYEVALTLRGVLAVNDVRGLTADPSLEAEITEIVERLGVRWVPTPPSAPTNASV